MQLNHTKKSGKSSKVATDGMSFNSVDWTWETHVLFLKNQTISTSQISSNQFRMSWRSSPNKKIKKLDQKYVAVLDIVGKEE